MTKWNVFGDIPTMYMIVHSAFCFVVGFLYRQEPVRYRENFSPEERESYNLARRGKRASESQMRKRPVGSRSGECASPCASRRRLDSLLSFAYESGKAVSAFGGQRKANIESVRNKTRHAGCEVIYVWARVSGFHETSNAGSVFLIIIAAG